MFDLSRHALGPESRISQFAKRAENVVTHDCQGVVEPFRCVRISTYQNICTPSTAENHMALALLCILGFIAYWVPTLAANSNRHRNRAAIGMLNLFLGWTFIGWVVALVWADTDNCEN